MSTIPIFDVHTHFHHTLGDPGIYVKAMKQNNIMKTVSLSQAYASIGTNRAYAYIAKLLYPDNFIVFTAVDYRDVGLGDEQFIKNACVRLADDVKHGAQGLKLHISNEALRIRSDDLRLGALFDKAAELNIPVLYHLNLQMRRDLGEQRASHLIPVDENFAATSKVFGDHPDTTFIIAHNASCCNRPSVERLWTLFEKYPNLHVDSSATFLFYSMLPDIELYKEHFTRYQDRILFGTDTQISAPIPPEILGMYFDHAYLINRAFLGVDGPFDVPDELRYRKREWVHDTRKWETLATFNDEFVGLGLDASILEKVFHKNAGKLIGSEQPLDKEWVIDQAKGLCEELKRAMLKSTTGPMNLSQYFCQASRLSGAFFNNVLETQGPEALRTAYNDGWYEPKDHTEKYIGTLEDAITAL